MQKQLQDLKIPSGYNIEFNSFFTYDPESEYSEKDNIMYLSEDLFQCVYQPKKIIVDLGWYGEIHSNDGEFKIYVVANQDWDNPLRTVKAKSLSKITNTPSK